MVAIDPGDAKALRYAGMLGHEYVVVRTYENAMINPDTSAEVNSLEQAKACAKTGDRIYRQIKRGKWQLELTVS